MTKQLYDSIDKLFHYIFPYVKQETTVYVTSNMGGGRKDVYERTFNPPDTINISNSLYSRIDSCHGAGNCCRVPFDLIYTPYCRLRILESDTVKNKDDLLASLDEYDVMILHSGISHLSKIYIKQNIDINPLSGNTSCPYLGMGDDRYWCGIHEFKPLHCWYPHMTVNQHGDDGGLNIGRRQYGRNHNFGCPVVFMSTTSDDELMPTDGINYFDGQFESDIYKLHWTSEATRSLGFLSDNNFAVGLDERLREQEQTIRRLISCGQRENIELWRNSGKSEARKSITV